MPPGRCARASKSCAGDPDTVAAVADSLDFEHKYTVGRDRVGAGRPADRRADRSGPRRVRKTAWAGLEPDRYAWTAVLHRERGGGVHVHILAARCDLETGRSLNIAPARLAEDLRPAARRLQPPARLEPPGRPGARQGAAAGPSRLPGGVEAAGRPRARSRPARVDPRLPAAARRARRGAEPRRRGRRPGGGRL